MQWTAMVETTMAVIALVASFGLLISLMIVSIPQPPL